MSDDEIPREEIEHSVKVLARDAGLLPALPEPQAVAPWAPSALALLSEDEFDRRLELAGMERERISQIQRAVMKQDVDYGVVPGTQKPTLLKPGAEILNKLAGFTPFFERERREGDGVSAPHIHYLIKCTLRDAAGNLIAEGDGSTNSWEKKYRYRNAERVCPACGAPAIIKGSDKYGGGWVCWKKRGGCGAKFEDGHAGIEEQQAGIEENPDPFDLDNTLLKMAAKRALIAATLFAHAASGIFTQDLEDMGPVKADAKPAAEKKKAAEKPAKTGGLTEGQHRLLFARAAHRAGQIGMTEDGDPKVVLDAVLKACGFDSIKDVTSDAKDHILETIETFEMPEGGQSDIPF